jgi:hypothetical protein
MVFALLLSELVQDMLHHRSLACANFVVVLDPQLPDSIHCHRLHEATGYGTCACSAHTKCN